MDNAADAAITQELQQLINKLVIIYIKLLFAPIHLKMICPQTAVPKNISFDETDKPPKTNYTNVFAQQILRANSDWLPNELKQIAEDEIRAEDLNNSECWDLFRSLALLFGWSLNSSSNKDNYILEYKN